MDLGRREFLKLTALGLGGLSIGGFSGGSSYGKTAYDEDRPLYCGWIYSPQSRSRFLSTQFSPFLSQLNEQIRDTGKGRTVLLWQAMEKVLGHPLIPHAQEIGDCVSHGFGLGVDVLTCVQMRQSLVPSIWVAPAATEIIYGGARVQVAKGRYFGDGCNGLDAAEFIKNYGILLRQKYVDGKFDYTRYSGQVANQLGRSGVPGPLCSLCRLHPVQTVSLVRSWAECRDAIANGYPVAMCSNVGFSVRRGRDSDGFLSPGRAPWNHCMLIAGIDDNEKRPGGLIINSWGNDWVGGPKRLGQPEGSFWADASVIDRAMKQNDSVALSQYVGYPPQDIDYRIF